jgi:hypothetical protein
MVDIEVKTSHIFEKIPGLVDLSCVEKLKSFTAILETREERVSNTTEKLRTGVRIIPVTIHAILSFHEQ